MTATVAVVQTLELTEGEARLIATTMNNRLASLVASRTRMMAEERYINARTLKTLNDDIERAQRIIELVKRPAMEVWFREQLYGE